MNFVFLVRSFVLNLVFLMKFQSKYVHQLPEKSQIKSYHSVILTNLQESPFDFSLCRSQKPWKVGKGGYFQDSTANGNVFLIADHFQHTVLNYLFKSGDFPRIFLWVSHFTDFRFSGFRDFRWFPCFYEFPTFLRFRRISRIFMFSVKIQLPPPPAPESFINVTISWCFLGAPFCETNIFVKIAVFGEIRWFSWKSVNFTENHDFHENDDFAGNGTPETSIIL